MDCVTCNVRNICKVYEAIKPYGDIANIVVTNCTVKRKGAIAMEETPQPTTQPVKMRNPEELITISDRIKELTPAEEQPSFIKCPDCEEEYEPKEFIFCNSCEKKLCMHCSVQEGPKRICEDCWGKEVRS